MKKVLALAVLITLEGMSTSFAGTKYSITYTNSTSTPATISYNSKVSHCWYQQSLPGSITVQQQASSPPYNTEAKHSGICAFGSTEPEILALDITSMGSTSTCEFVNNGETLTLWNGCKVATVAPGTAPKSMIIYVVTPSPKNKKNLSK